MRVDLHNHTPLCNHATNKPEESILKAIQLGIDIFGFSDHAPMNFDQKYRMKFKDMQIYEREISKLRDKFQDKIEILIGYEVDYLKGYIDEKVLKRDVDYFIGSVHFLGNWGFDNPEFIGKYKNQNIDDIWQKYFDAIENMAKFGKFDIIGHLDLIKVFKYLPQKDIKLIAKNAIKAIKKSNMCVEINAAGFRKPVNEQYPSKELLQMCYESDIPITFGSDAHSLEQIGFGYEKVVNIAKEIGYNSCITFKNRNRVMIKF